VSFQKVERPAFAGVWPALIGLLLYSIHLRVLTMQNPYKPIDFTTRHAIAAQSRNAISVRAVLLAPLAAFVISIVLGAMAGIFIALFAGTLSDGNGETTIVFDAIFFPAFVWLPFLLCGYFAGRMAHSHRVTHALYAGCVYLCANVAMSLPWDTQEPYFWTHMLNYALIIPLAALGTASAHFGQDMHTAKACAPTI
jgi:hypothetical protein